MEHLATLLGENIRQKGCREIPQEEREKDELEVAPATEDKWRKLDIPTFDGDDAYGWVQKLERYFC